jgi:filamentous haemagglutinin family N-terminal domain
MNLIYKLIWNDSLGAFTVASELTRARGKCPRRARVVCGLMLAAAAMGGQAQSLPTGAEITVGQGSILQTGNTLTITQDTQNLAINWQQFNVGANETVRFAQPNASAIALNRVLGSDPSQIHGAIEANGQVWLLNPNGVLFGNGAQVNVGGLVASTLNISDADFLAGNRTLSGSGNGHIVNYGNISARYGGYVALLGGQVSNQGVVSAKLGTVALASGERITLDFAGDSLLNVSVDAGTLDALVDNRQLIRADGGQVIMTARASDAVLDTIVNNTGIVEARTVERQGGVVKLLGGFEGGTVNVGGTLDASAPNGGDGGFIDTSGHKVTIADDARITTRAADGRTGTWLIDPNDYTIGAGGDITGAQLSAQLADNNVVIRSIDGADTLGNGDIFVNDAVSWSADTTLTLEAERNIEVNAAIANSGNGNLVLRADSNGISVGTVSFGADGAISMAGGRTDIYYNVADYATPTDFSPYISSGDHTAWMLVNEIDQLQAIQNNLAGNYALGRDIDATATVGWNLGAGFIPLGTFTGALDGLNHTIDGLVIDRSSNQVGLFSVLSSTSAVSNLGLTDVVVAGTSSVGALAGAAEGAITNVYSTGTVSATSVAVGGLIGVLASPHSSISNSYSEASVHQLTVYPDNGKAGGLVGSMTSGAAITNSYATGDVSGYTDVGGLVGAASFGSLILESYATGEVTGAHNIGGLVGDAIDVSIIQSHATGDVSSYAQVGGLLGWGTRVVISQSYAAGNVSATGGLVGGLVGVAQDNSTVTDSYATGTIAGDGYVGGLIGHAYAGVSINKSYATGTVSGTDNVGGLLGVAEDISISHSYAEGSVTGFDYVGGLLGVAENTSISHSYAKGSVTGFDYVGGLVGYAEEDQTVFQSYATGAVSGDRHVGGLIGHASNDASIAQSYATGDVSGRLDAVGGLIGFASTNIAITGSYATGTVEGDLWVGGLIGRASNISITGSHASGAVHGDTDVGGLIGRASNSTLISTSYASARISGRIGVGGLVGDAEVDFEIADSYAHGEVVGDRYVGGLVGAAAWNGLIANSYATGTVNGAVEVGGLVGIAITNIAISQSYATGTVIGQSDVDPTIGHAIGGLVGWLSDSSITQSYATGAVVGVHDVGGLVGTVRGSSSVTESYAANTVTGNFDFGGLFGSFDGNDITVSRSFWDVGLSGLTDPVSSSGPTADMVGLSTADMMEIGSFTGWDIADQGGSSAVWRIYEGRTYPLLRTFLTPLTLSLTSSAVTKTYDGLAFDASGIIDATGLKSGESLNDLLGMLSYGAADGARNVGVYTVELGGLYSNQQGYDIEYVGTATLNIDPRTLTIDATAQNRTYDGTTAATVTLTDDRIAGDDLTISFSSASFDDKNAGTGKMVTVFDISVTGADANNYTWNNTATATADIHRRTLNVTADAQDKTYDGTTAATATLDDDRVAGDALMLGYASADFDDKNVGTGKTVTVAGIAVTGADADNYTWNTTTTTTASIERATLSVTGATAQNRAYDGTTPVAIQGATLSGVFGNDAVTLTNANTGSMADKHVGNGKAVTTAMGLSGADANNYVLLQPAGLTVDITPRELLISATGHNRTYDGTTVATVTLDDDRVAGDLLSLSHASAAFDDKNAGQGKTVTVAGISVTGDDANNYTWNTTATATADIERAMLHITAVGHDRLYDGTTPATVTLEDDRIAGDVLSLSYASAAFLDAAVGSDKQIEVLGISVTGADAHNYTWNTSTSAVANIFESRDLLMPLSVEQVLPEDSEERFIKPFPTILQISGGIRLPEGLQDLDE